ncbi:hypothetical protein D9M70_388720 [compost metagenome]
MRGDEGNLIAADKEARDQEQVALVAERFLQRLADRLFVLRLALATGGGIATQWNREERHQQHEDAEIDEAVRPAIGGDQPLAQRREQEHTGRARRRADAEGERPLMRRDVAGKGRQENAEGAGADRHADEHAATDMQPDRRIGKGHDEQARSIEKARHGKHPPSAEPVSDRAEEGLAQAPAEVLQGHRKAESRPVPAGVGEHRQLEEAHRRARAEGEHRNDRTSRDDQPGHLLTSMGRCGCSGNSGHEISPIDGAAS